MTTSNDTPPADDRRVQHETVFLGDLTTWAEDITAGFTNVIDSALLTPEAKLLRQVSADILNEHCDINDPAEAPYQRLSAVLLLEALIASPAAVDNALRLLRSLLLEEDPELARLRAAFGGPEPLTEKRPGSSGPAPRQTSTPSSVLTDMESINQRDLLINAADGLLLAVEHAGLKKTAAAVEPLRWSAGMDLEMSDDKDTKAYGLALVMSCLVRTPEVLQPALEKVTDELCALTGLTALLEE